MTTTRPKRDEPPYSPGLEGVIAATTDIGEVRGAEGFFHYRGYDATELARSCSFEDVWHLLFYGELPDDNEARAFTERAAGLRALPDDLAARIGDLCTGAPALVFLRSAVSLLGALAHFAPAHDLCAQSLRDQAMGLIAKVPTLIALSYRHEHGLEAITPRSDLSFSASYLHLVTGQAPSFEVARALEQYLVLTIDHGFNASTFTARVIASTGTDLAASICGAIGAMSGPLHGGAPARALAMLEEIGSAANAASYVHDLVSLGGRVMGFGHRVYKGNDPRSMYLRDLCVGLRAPLAPFAVSVEKEITAALATEKPGRDLHANVEFYAGVVMGACGIPEELFSATFTCARLVGWCAHVLEQCSTGRLIRPRARYLGPPPLRALAPRPA